MRKSICILTALFLLLALPMAALAEVHTDSFPIVDEPITLTAFATAGPYTKGDFNDLAIWGVMEKLTGVTINFEAAPSEQSAEKLGLLFAANTLPDIIFKTGITNADVTNYAAEGQLIAIDSYLETYAPNFNAMLTGQPEIRKAITLADGHIYGFPYIVTASPAIVSPKLFYNVKYLEQQGLTPADTLDDLTAQLRAFKTSDFNGNGQADEIPLSSESLSQMMIPFYGSFGLATRGTNSQEWDIDPETSALRYVPTSDGYRDMLAYISSLYTEGLIDQEIFTNDLAAFQAKAEQNIVYFAPIHNNNYLGTYKNDFAGLPAPLSGPSGDKYWAGVSLAVSTGNTFITGNCQNIEAAIRYIDYFYSQDGILLYFMGVEGETYTIDESGKPHFTEYVTKNPDGMNMEEALGTYVCWSGGGNPSVADDEHFGVHLIPEITVTAAQNLKAFGPTEVWPPFTYTEEQTELLTDLKLDISTYVTDMRAKFISGSESFDKWDEYVATIDRMGLEDYRAIVQAGLDRYTEMN